MTPDSPIVPRPVVLIVDDEPALRRIVAVMLERGGFDSLEARNGEEALRIFKDRRESIHSVLLDLAMPKISGIETFIRLRDIDADIPIFLCSGCPVSSDQFKARTGICPTGVITKPFDAETLCAAIRRPSIDFIDKVQAIMRPLVHALNNRALAIDSGAAPLKIENLTLVDIIGAYCKWRVDERPPEFWATDLYLDDVTNFSMCMAHLFKNTAETIGPADDPP